MPRLCIERLTHGRRTRFGGKAALDLDGVLRILRSERCEFGGTGSRGPHLLLLHVLMLVPA